MKTIRKCICSLLAGSLSVGVPLFAGDPVGIRSADVALNTGGLLRGTVLNTAARPVSGISVSVLHDDKTVATVLSDEKGDFSVKGLRNGAHVVQAGTTHQIVRLWGTNSAPPAAVETIAIVVDDETIRGQSGGGIGGLGRLGTWGLIGIATAVTLGTTLGNDAKNSPASP